MNRDFQEDLTLAILDRTSGPPCRRARELLGAGDASGLDRGLLAAHLAACPACRQMEAALALASAVLPSLAVLEPGPFFTAKVLRETTRRPEPEPFWRRLLARPRICLESAYLGTVAGFLCWNLLPAGLTQKVPAAVAFLDARPGAARAVERVKLRGRDNLAGVERRVGTWKVGVRTVFSRVRNPGGQPAPGEPPSTGAPGAPADSPPAPANPSRGACVLPTDGHSASPAQERP